MVINKNKHQRQSIRLRGYDYSRTKSYFVTVCTKDKECLLGEIVDGKMRSNEIHKMVQSVWNELPLNYPGVKIDAFVIMPNHVHGIIILDVGAPPRGCPKKGKGQAQGPAPTLSLPDVVHRLKSLTTAKYRQKVTEGVWQPFKGRFWHRNYYERVIRRHELTQIRQYIRTNPKNWETDTENPHNMEIIPCKP